MKTFLRIFSGLVLLLPLFGSACQQESPASSTHITQLIQYREAFDQAQIQLAPGIAVPAEEPGYTLILPGQSPLGMIVLFHSGRDTTHPGYEQRLYVEAIKRRVASLYVTTGNPFEFLFDSLRYEQLDRYIGEVVDSFDIPKNKLLFAGMSLAGTRALKFGHWCMSGHSAYQLRPRAIAICDAPLDFQRFWREGQRARHLQVHPASVSEATWVNAQLEKNLKGTPTEVPDAYAQYSPYVYGLDIDPKLNQLKTVAFRAYTEPDVHWWIQNRGKDYYAMNAIDAAAVVNDLILLGNTEAELITTSNKGYHPDGRRHPHSWSIVDNGDLVDWLLALPAGE